MPDMTPESIKVLVVDDDEDGLLLIRDSISEGIVTIRENMPIPFTPLQLNKKAIQEKILAYHMRLGKFGEDVVKIIGSIFK
jgi:response regulator RpfG family c-di-GMP phosphodiesterase